MPKISIIVPIYKAERYIHRCIDSILAQTFTDFELILVDDGSPDNCGDICDDYARQDDRIHVIHQNNKGVASARNAGIDWVMTNNSSEWIHFVDSDDWVHPEILERLLAAAEKNGTDISVCHYIETDGTVKGGSRTGADVCTAKSLFVAENVLSVVPWAKLYRKKCFSEIRYPENRYAEDEFTTYKILFAEKRIAVLEDQLYFYFYNNDGLSKMEWSPRHVDKLDALEEQMQFFWDRNDMEMYCFCLRNCLSNASRQLMQLKENNLSNYDTERRWIEKKIKEMLRLCWKYGQISFWDDYEILRKFYPVHTCLYRVYNAMKKRMGLNYDA